ncbi:hypothetical protein [Vibrio parahaemolyticus]|uniref:hypothetical protein n=1 Tax=Vibrio parahaemolyticus TaxID=670 RepID=UPI0017845592|nr:hypothetical protein [Vibrio parahaemolyticus]MBD6945038.1 hypothetical protein [Vibrio parahaemolyticus]MBD6978935.1 hypothetical protein [Vibrio parahaemolyticus]WOZ62901.1 hypothetical protein RHS38_26150 [Vibrio parahaemolyticus]
MNHLDIQFHYFTESHYLLHRNNQFKLQENIGTDVQEKLSESAFTLSIDATRDLLTHLGHAYFDYRIDIITPNQLPYRGENYLSLSNPNYATSELNDDYIEELSQLENEEIQQLVHWMKAHKQERWYLVGLIEASITGITCDNINVELRLSPYVFASDDRKKGENGND